jgi:hypothetical protein
MRHHFRHPQAMFNKGSLFYSHCAVVVTKQLSEHYYLSHATFPFHRDRLLTQKFLQKKTMWLKLAKID